MQCLKSLFFTAVITFFAFVTASAQICAKNTLKVGVLLNVDEVTIAADKKYNIDAGGKNFYLTAGKINVKFLNGKIKINNKICDLPVKIYGPSFLAANKTVYRGILILKLSSDNKLNVINEIPVEDYLKGILPKEADPSWNIEALKVQAVISRSYALKNLSKHSKDGFDVCSTVHCQVYGGASAENEKCNKAVAETTGEVVMYKDEIAQTLFHATCGGYTEDPKYVWQWKTKTPEYLRGIKDKYCKNSPQYEWTSTISEKNIREKLIKAGYKTGKIKSIKTSGKTKGKSKEKILIKYDGGKLSLNSYKFRLAVDPWLIKSTMISSIKKKNNDFIFKGNGWGHKVGLCQWGAKEMGDKGFSYKQILIFYYPGTRIGTVTYDK